MALLGIEEFLKEIKEGNIDIVRGILKENPKIVNCKKSTPLCTAIKCKHIEIIKLLIESGADVEQCTCKYVESPLFHAIVTKNIDILNLLLDTCDINKRIGVRYYTALHEAIDHENEAVVCRLLECEKININPQDEREYTPLHIAVEKDLLNIVKILIADPKIDVNLKNQSGLTAGMVNTSGNTQACKLVQAKLPKRNSMGSSTNVHQASSDDSHRYEFDNSSGQRGKIPSESDFALRPHGLDDLPFETLETKTAEVVIPYDVIEADDPELSEDDDPEDEATS